MPEASQECSRCVARERHAPATLWVPFRNPNSHRPATRWVPGGNRRRCRRHRKRVAGAWQHHRIRAPKGPSPWRGDRGAGFPVRTPLESQPSGTPSRGASLFFPADRGWRVSATPRLPSSFPPGTQTATARLPAGFPPGTKKERRRVSTVCTQTNLPEYRSMNFAGVIGWGLYPEFANGAKCRSSVIT